MMSVIIRGMLMAAAVVALLVPWPPALVERLYAQRLYPFWNSLVAPAAASVPVAVFDVLVIMVVLWTGRALWRIVRPTRGGRVRALLQAMFGTVTLAASLYLAFWASWGLNYQREGLDARLELDAARATEERVDQLADVAAARLNRLHVAHRAQSWPELSESPSAYRKVFEDTIRRLGVKGEVHTPAPKPTLFAFYLRWAAIDGVTSPFTHEILVNPYVLGPERPMIVAHEWAHVAGFARESEANFVAALTCLRGDLHMQYSAWLQLLPLALATRSQDRRRAVLALLEEGPRADLAAIDARVREALPLTREIAWRSYDSYLRAHHVANGVASYGEVLTWLLGSRADEDWDLPAVPRLR